MNAELLKVGDLFVRKYGSGHLTYKIAQIIEEPIQQYIYQESRYIDTERMRKVFKLQLVLTTAMVKPKGKAASALTTSSEYYFGLGNKYEPLEEYIEYCRAQHEKFSKVFLDHYRNVQSTDSN